jgi:hypothetical protein
MERSMVVWYTVDMGVWKGRRGRVVGLEHSSSSKEGATSIG